MITRVSKARQGYALAIVLLYVTVATALFASVTTLLLREYRATRISAGRLQALYAAEAGVDMALHELVTKSQAQPVWQGWTQSGTTYSMESTPPLLFDQSMFPTELSVEVDMATLQIKATGRVLAAASPKPVCREVVVTITRAGEQFTIQNWTCR